MRRAPWTLALPLLAACGKDPVDTGTGTPTTAGTTDTDTDTPAAGIVSVNLVRPRGDFVFFANVAPGDATRTVTPPNGEGCTILQDLGPAVDGTVLDVRGGAALTLSVACR